MVEIIDIFYNPIFTSVLSGGIGILATYLAAIQKFRKDLEAEFDKDLRSKRIASYKPLWNDLRIVSVTEMNLLHKVTYNDLVYLMQHTHDWYFCSGGIFLSISSRKWLFELKNSIMESLKEKIGENIDITKLLNREENYEHINDKLEKDHSEKILKNGRNLRTSLANDIGGRRKNRLLSLEERSQYY